MYDRQTLEEALRALGDLLADRDESYEVVAIGGGALSLLGLVDRSTEDIDLVGLLAEGSLVSPQPVPAPLAMGIADVAALHQLTPTWMNNGPWGLLVHGLPHGFLERCVRRKFGGLTVLLASRFDLIHFKLLATSSPADKHYHDLRRLSPTRDELLAAVRWARSQATGEVFEMELRGALKGFGVDPDDG